VQSFETVPEQDEAKRLLRAALAEGPAHAYLLHGPPGVGKRRAALAFAGELIGDPARVARRTHPDLYVLEPLGDQIRIDPVREMRRDLHMRPFEADRRVYVVHGAHLMNEDAADALLKDLEEPPPYAVIVLVADELGPLPDTIRSRCQLVPFRRLSRGAVKAWLASRGLEGEPLEIAARVAAGRLDRAERLLDAHAGERRRAVLDLARSVYRDPAFEPGSAAAQVGKLAAVRGEEARAKAEEEARTAAEAGIEEPKRELDQRLRRAERGAEREEVLHALDTLASWYRDLVVVGSGADRAALNSDRLVQLAEDAGPDTAVRAERAAEAVRATWRSFEFNVSTGLALEALFVRLRRELAAPVPVAGAA
jgi:DNA polymerase III subunit delta'